MHKKSLKKSKAFSMVELSIVVLIIGIIISGITVSGTIVKKAKDYRTKSSTQSSVVNRTKGVVLWLEAGLDGSFLATGLAETGSIDEGTAITGWYNNKTTGSARNQATAPGTVANQPTRARGISNIPTVRFDGNDSITVDASAITNRPYTIIAVGKRACGGTANYFMGDSAVSSDILIGYSAATSINHSQSTTVASANVADCNGSDKGAIIIATSDQSGNKKIYVNGILAATTTGGTGNAAVGNIVIGKNFTGDIGEIIVIDHEVSASDRDKIENYLSNKWGISLGSGTCPSTGTIVGSTCRIDSCTVATITGITSPATVTPGSGSLTCNATGYSGSVSYTCDSTTGAFNSSGSCSCASGYTMVSGTCQQNCAVSIAGVSTTSVDAGTSGSFTCNAPAYTGSPTYNCVNGNLNASGSCSCGSGYTLVSGTCQQNCAVSITGVSTTSVNAGTSGNLTCATGYTGSPTYTCTNGSLSTGGTACSVIQCTFNGTTGVPNGTVVNYTSSSTPASCTSAGYTGSVNYTCTSTGAPSVSGSCTAITCAFNGTTGIANGTVVNYTNSGSRSCDSGYTGGPIAYKCLAAGAPTSIAGSCSMIAHWEDVPSPAYANLVLKSYYDATDYTVSYSSSPTTCTTSRNGYYIRVKDTASPSGANYSDTVYGVARWVKCHCFYSGIGVDCWTPITCAPGTSHVGATTSATAAYRGPGVPGHKYLKCVSQ